MEQIIKISNFILASFVHIWPYLLITIPLAVLVKMSGAANNINKVLRKNVFASIFLATAIGAVSPFCSCGVIPIIASLLIGGVPLAPVMSFWIASPSMDPEIFLLSVAAIGWKMSIWRLAATFAISLFSGIITHFAQKNGFFGDEILRNNQLFNPVKMKPALLLKFKEWARNIYTLAVNQKQTVMQLIEIDSPFKSNVKIDCCISTDNISEQVNPLSIHKDKTCMCPEPENAKETSIIKKIITETWSAFSMVAKFMAIAFLINALIQFYLPEDYIVSFLGNDSPFSVFIATLIGIPFYASNMTALPMVSGLLTIGMNQGAALAFLIAGPTTTLPAMMAVWGIVKPKVFLVYLSFTLFGALFFGYLYNFFS